MLDNPTVSGLLLAEAGYASGRKKESTVTTGDETIQVKIPTKGIRGPGFDQFEGKTFSIKSVQHVTVHVKVFLSRRPGVPDRAGPRRIRE